ncbi:hypothetical protein BDZ91DRAFT_758131 [Kalaharituber pfeilii]|nr:hypothetical protein BDZ91DRAFT_758131 [Kalaharituber pfeilii]
MGSMEGGEEDMLCLAAAGGETGLGAEGWGGVGGGGGGSVSGGRRLVEEGLLQLAGFASGIIWCRHSAQLQAGGNAARDGREDSGPPAACERRTQEACKQLRKPPLAPHPAVVSTKYPACGMASQDRGRDGDGDGGGGRGRGERDDRRSAAAAGSLDVRPAGKQATSFGKPLPTFVRVRLALPSSGAGLCCWRWLSIHASSASRLPDTALRSKTIAPPL